MINYPLEITYIIASVLFIMGLKGLGHPESARRGMHYAEIGMLMAVIGTLLGQNIVTWQWILIGLVIGSVIGTTMAIFMPMSFCSNAPPSTRRLFPARSATAIRIISSWLFRLPEISSQVFDFIRFLLYYLKLIDSLQKQLRCQPA